MTDQLPEHLERLLGNSGDWICVKCGPTDATFHENCTNCGTPLATDQEVTKLRAILTAACAVAEEPPIELSTQDLNPLCAYCGVLLLGWEEHLPECEHRRLKEALNDD